MDIENLLNPILDQGIRHTNFFEGRLLTGEDLRNQQQANREHDKCLGRAIGSGIIEGLEVILDEAHDGSDGQPPIVTVKKGLAVNAKGEVIGLPEDDIKLALSKVGKVTKIEQADFINCVGGKGSQHHPNSACVYMLVMSPTSGYKERAPKSGLGDGGVVKGCGNRYIQEGVQFRLVELTTDMLINLEENSEEIKQLIEKDLLNINKPVMKKDDVQRLSKLRNILAHLCFGTEQIANLFLDPFNIISANSQSPRIGYGVLDELRRREDVIDCDVPLSLVYWSLDGVAFIDNWSVRRPLENSYESNVWSTLIGNQQAASRRAMFLQFQDQITSLVSSSGDLGIVTARNHFHFLPAVAVIPVAEETDTTDAMATRFFKEMTYRSPAFINAARLEALLLQSLQFPPISTQSNEMIWLYRVRENRTAIDFPAGSKRPQSYLVLSTGHLPYQADAQYDLAYFDYSNYALAR